MTREETEELYRAKARLLYSQVSDATQKLEDISQRQNLSLEDQESIILFTNRASIYLLKLLENSETASGLQNEETLDLFELSEAFVDSIAEID